MNTLRGFLTPRRSGHIWANRPINVRLAKWFAVVHVLALAAAVYVYVFGVTLETLCVLGVWFLCRHLSIRVGVHSLYSHRAFKVRPTHLGRGWEYWNAAWFGGTFQGHLDWWAVLHRIHHAFSDLPRDPYSVLDGFLWAHTGWILRAPTELRPGEGKDLADNPAIVWQKKHYLAVAIIVALVLPAAITMVLAGIFEGVSGLLRGFVEGFLVVGWFGLCIQYHFTWCINSAAHMWGCNRFGHRTARSNPLLLGLQTMGEGSAHDRHHGAPRDYRIDPRWWAPDIGKWYIWLLSDEGPLGKYSVFCELQRVSDEEARAHNKKHRARKM